MKILTEKWMKGVTLFCIIMLLTGCATIMTGRRQTIPITTKPSGATVIIAGERHITPTTVTLERKHHYTVTIEKEGYHTETVEILSVISGAVAGNILIGGIIGGGIDAITGAAKKLQPESISINLVPLDTKTEKTVTERLQEAEKLRAEEKISDEEYIELREKILKEF